MKKTILYTFLAAGILLGSMAFGAPATSTGAAVAPPMTAPRTGITPVTPVNGAGRPVTPAQNGNNFQTTSSFQSSTTTSNQFGVTTNEFANTNGLAGTNGFGGTNGSSVTAFVNPATNVSPSFNTNFNASLQDQTTTSSDRVLLTTLSQGVRATLGIQPNGNMPVHFFINNGTVTVVGTVQSSAQTQSVMSQVQQTPGVLGVVNDLHVAAPLATAQSRVATQATLLGTPTDRAFTPRDQTLLTMVQQQTAMQLGVTSSSQMPVHFSIQDGVVGVTGQVSSLQEKQALIAAVQRIPGIVRVVDNVGVTASSTTGTTGIAPVNNGTTVNPFSNNALSPTGNPSNSVFLNNTNASGF